MFGNSGQRNPQAIFLRESGAEQDDFGRKSLTLINSVTYRSKRKSTLYGAINTAAPNDRRRYGPSEFEYRMRGRNDRM